jgi:hypothetical protein
VHPLAARQGLGGGHPQGAQHDEREPAARRHEDVADDDRDDGAPRRVDAAPDEGDADHGDRLEGGREHRAGGEGERLGHRGREQARDGDRAAQDHEHEEVHREPAVVAQRALELLPRRLVGIVVDRVLRARGDDARGPAGRDGDAAVLLGVRGRGQHVVDGPVEGVHGDDVAGRLDARVPFHRQRQHPLDLLEHCQRLVGGLRRQDHLDGVVQRDLLARTVRRRPTIGASGTTRPGRTAHGVRRAAGWAQYSVTPASGAISCAVM